MVDFGELKDKAEGFVSEHTDEVKSGIGKVGDFVGEKIGHQDQVQAAEQKVSDAVDNLGGQQPQQ